MDSNWIAAAIAIVAGVVLGSLASRFARRFSMKPNRPDALQQSASAIGSMAFSVMLVIGLMVALAIVRVEALDQITSDLVSYIPRIISAGIVLILGNLAGTLAGTAVAQAMGRAAGKAAGQVPSVVKGVILAFSVILASSQLGIDVTIVYIAVAALLFSLGLAASLLIGYGGRTVSAEIAAGRALKRVLAPGDAIRADDMNGVILTVHSTAVEMEVNGESLLVPNSELMDSTLSIQRAEPPEDS